MVTTVALIKIVACSRLIPRYVVSSVFLYFPVQGGTAANDDQVSEAYESKVLASTPSSLCFRIELSSSARMEVASAIAGLAALADLVFTKTLRYVRLVKSAEKTVNDLA